MSNELIKMIRVNLQLNQNEFSNLIGIHRSELALVDAGYRSPSEKLVKAVKSAVDAEFIRMVRAIADYGISGKELIN